MWSLLRETFGASLGEVIVLAATDPDGRSWRIEISESRARVYRQHGALVEATPVRAVTDLASLGDWLVERGLRFEDLRET